MEVVLVLSFCAESPKKAAKRIECAVDCWIEVNLAIGTTDEEDDYGV